MNDIVTIVVAVFASVGFWEFLKELVVSKSKTKSNEQKLILGLAFDRIVKLCEHYIKRGYIDTEEYKELNKYLFEPYQALGGNGTAQRLIKEVEKLPIKKGDAQHE